MYQRIMTNHFYIKYSFWEEGLSTNDIIFSNNEQSGIKAMKALYLLFLENMVIHFPLRLYSLKNCKKNEVEGHTCYHF